MTINRASVWLVLAICLAQPSWAGAAAGATVGSTPGAEQVKPLCAACHGAQGVSSIPAIPSLAGQPKVFIENQLVMIREGLREVPAMTGMLDKLSDADLTSLATWYAELKLNGPTGPTAQSPATPPSSARIAAGATMAKQALCGTCHLPTYVGQSQVPRLAGQHEEYLQQTMVLMRDGKAVGRDSIMSSTLRGMSDEQLRDLAHYFSNLRSF
jgi:cytochrome c553